MIVNTLSLRKKLTSSCWPRVAILFSVTTKTADGCMTRHSRLDNKLKSYNTVRVMGRF